MNQIIDLLFAPFLACVLLVIIHCQFGLHVLRKNVVFVDLALAQCAALGATIAFMQGHLPQSLGSYSWSLGFALMAALILSLVRFAPKKIPAESLVGVLYIVSAAAAILMIEKAPQGAEHLKQILTGSILTIELGDLKSVTSIYIVISLILIYLTNRNFFDKSGFGGWLSDLIFYCAFAFVVTSSVAIAGVLLVFSFLIIPAIIGLSIGKSFWNQWLYGCIVGSFSAAIGLLSSYWLDTSSGSTIVCIYGLVLAIFIIFTSLREYQQYKSFVIYSLTIGILLTLTMSASWFAIKPKADQPLLDLTESYIPALKFSYFSSSQKSIYLDAEKYVARYKSEINRLSELEAKNRWTEKESDDLLVQKITSFQQSYNEMIKGETFVMREIRSRAREAIRWYVAAAAVFFFGIILWILKTKSKNIYLRSA